MIAQVPVQVVPNRRSELILSRDYLRREWARLRRIIPTIDSRTQQEMAREELMTCNYELARCQAILDWLGIG